MRIRKAKESDLETILRIYALARERMRAAGNPQWGTDRPAPDTVAADIENGQSYVAEVDGQVRAVFALVFGADPTYEVIEDGAWLNGDPYGTVHRVASDGQVHGVLYEILAYCEDAAGNVRIDTHEKNAPMRHILAKCGYRRCGIIYEDDGTPRIAYQKDARRLPLSD